MATVIVGTGGLQPSRPRRFGKYDRWLDGRMWRLSAADIPTPWRRFRHIKNRWHGFRMALAWRARARGLRLSWNMPKDGQPVIVATERKSHGVDVRAVQTSLPLPDPPERCEPVQPLPEPAAAKAKRPTTRAGRCEAAERNRARRAAALAARTGAQPAPVESSVKETA